MCPQMKKEKAGREEERHNLRAREAEKPVLL